MRFELSYGDIFILFFLTLGPLKAILPFARATAGTEPAFRRAVAWRAVVIATVIVLVVALLGPFVLRIGMSRRRQSGSPAASSYFTRRCRLSCGRQGQCQGQRARSPARHRPLRELRFSR